VLLPAAGGWLVGRRAVLAGWLLPRRCPGWLRAGGGLAAAAAALSMKNIVKGGNKKFVLLALAPSSA
jgi:hypothetical protein